MANKYKKQNNLSQVFLRDKKLVQKLIRICSIEPEDIVYEIGPGKGILTTELARVSRKVVAVEKDVKLANRLKDRFRLVNNVEVVTQDFRFFKIRSRDYKVVANIPFSITADVIRKLLLEKPCINEAYLILQNEAAQKFSGCPHECQFSLLVKPDYEFSNLYRFRRTDFFPVPSVDSVLLQIRKRKKCLITKDEAPSWNRFIKYGFGKNNRNLKQTFRREFTYLQWKHLSENLGFNLHANPAELSFKQWLGLFRFYNQLC